MKSDRCRLGLVTLALVGLASCTGSEPTTPNPRAPAEPGLVRTVAAAAASEQETPFVRCHRRAPVAASADIGPAGGRITAGGNRLIIPSGALARTVHITLGAPGDGRAFIALGPTGLVFQKQVRLVFNVTGCDVSAPDDEESGAAALYAAYVNDSGQIVEVLPAHSHPLTHTVSAAIRHFSGYALAW